LRSIAPSCLELSKNLSVIPSPQAKLMFFRCQNRMGIVFFLIDGAGA